MLLYRFCFHLSKQIFWKVFYSSHVKPQMLLWFALFISVIYLCKENTITPKQRSLARAFKVRDFLCYFKLKKLNEVRSWWFDGQHWLTISRSYQIQVGISRTMSTWLIYAPNFFGKNWANTETLPFAMYAIWIFYEGNNHSSPVLL